MFKKNGKIYMWVEIKDEMVAMKLVSGPLHMDTITQKMKI